MEKIPLYFDRDLLQEGIRHYINWNFVRLPHTLVIGATGSGKSCASKLLIARSALYIPDAQVTICDFKADTNDFGFLVNCPRYYRFTDCAEGLDTFYKALQARQSGEDTSKTFRLLMFDEWASFLNTLDKKEAEAAKLKLATLLMLSRSFGMKILISQQRADSQYFNSSRDNFHNIIALGNISKESATMFGFDRDQMKPVNNVGSGYMLTNGTDLRAIQVPVIRNVGKLEQAIKFAVTR